jgi:hypothetical protein
MTKFQKAILKRIDIFLKLFSNFLVSYTIESKVVKTLTDKDLETITPITTSYIFWNSPYYFRGYSLFCILLYG